MTRPPRPPSPRATRPERRGKYKRGNTKPAHDPNEAPITFFDGEGRGRDPHLYTYLAAVTEFGDVKGELYNKHGIETVEGLNFFLELGVKRCFGFSIGYDLTKLLADLPPTAIYKLCRPEERKRKGADGKTIHDPVRWRGFRLDYLRGKLTIRRTKWSAEKGKNVDEGPSVILWDIWRFFQSKFVTALLDWKVATEEELAEMTRMKEGRADFGNSSGGVEKFTEADVQKYCKDECVKGAELVRRLIDAHDHAELKLTQFYGAGSTAGAMMKKYEVKEYMPEGKYPPEMRVALYKNFFGGRFETSIVGPVPGPVYNYDISSAYPYQMTRLPCLRCGQWRFLQGSEFRKALPHSRLAMVHVRVTDAPGRTNAWGPFPFRNEKGEITFPKAAGGQWVWKDEYYAGLEVFKDGIEAREGWVYDTPCSHEPFGFMPQLYRERLKIGKEGAGIVIKLGMNSGYGKTAQSTGDHPFQSFVWAGNITSNTRAQLLYAIKACKDPWSILMFATDGVFSTEKLVMPVPVDTGTGEVTDNQGKVHRKPLGGWEEKIYERGIFILRPGIYFPLKPTAKDAATVKARGMSRSVLFANAPRIEAHFERYGTTRPFVVHGFTPADDCGCPVGEDWKVEHVCRCIQPLGKERGAALCGEGAKGHGEGIPRFVGMNSGVFRPNPKKKAVRLDPDYGEWVPYPIISSFSPLPKRNRMLEGNRLSLHEMEKGESAMYDKAVKSDEAIQLQAAAAILADQADGDFAEHAEVLAE